MPATWPARSNAPQPIAVERIQVIAAASPDPMALYAVDAPGKYRHEWVDPRWGEFLGMNTEEMVGRYFEELFAGPATNRFHAAAGRAIAEGRSTRYTRIKRGGPSPVAMEVTVIPLRFADALQLVVLTRDVSDQIAGDAEGEVNERRLSKLMEHTADGVWLIAADGTIRYVTNSMCRMLGVDAADLVGRNSLDLVDSDHRPYAEALLATTLDSDVDDPVQAEVPLRDANGSIRWLQCTVTNLVTDPDVGAIVVNSHDVTERKLLEERLAGEARQDTLTGLPNRASVSERITSMLHTATGGDHLAAVLFVDFDGFKLINDTLGHDRGDIVIREAARRLEATVGGRGWVARFGGDEFIVVAADHAPVQHHLQLADSLRAALGRPFDLNGSPTYLTASIGLATGDRFSGSDADDMLRNADMAMYEAKRRGHNSVQLFDERLRQQSETRLETRNTLRSAIDDDRLRLDYQPIFDSAAQHVVAVEALLRWDHPTRGLVYPLDFIGIAEETGLIVPIGAWVFDRVCRQLAEWDEQGYARVQAAVNVSPRQLNDPEFVHKVRASVSRWGVDPSSLIIEITENLIMEDPETSRRVLEELASLGLGCAIDDFGMGYSSLSYLARFPATVLKIDREFVAPLANGLPADDVPHDHSTALVAAMVGMGHALGLAVVAEGVETAEQLVALRRLGCEYAQGYHLARPAPAAEIERMLRRRRSMTPL